MPPVQPYIAIFELVRPFDHRMMPWKFGDGIFNGSGVILLKNIQTNKQTNKQTDTTENNTIFAARLAMNLSTAVNSL